MSSFERLKSLEAQIPSIIGIKTATVPELLSPADMTLERMRIARIIWRSVLA